MNFQNLDSAKGTLLLIVTGQPAADIRIPAVMAFDTILHVPDLPRQALKIGNLSMTRLTSHFGVDVALVIEKNVFRHIIDFHPRCGLLFVKVMMLFEDLRMLCDDIVVTM